MRTSRTKIANCTALASGDLWLLNRLLRNTVNGDVNTDWSIASSSSNNDSLPLGPVPGPILTCFGNREIAPFHSPIHSKNRHFSVKMLLLEGSIGNRLTGTVSPYRISMMDGICLERLISMPLSHLDQYQRESPTFERFGASRGMDVYD